MTKQDRAWKAFRARVAELGGSVIEPAWLGSKTPHRVRCIAGHNCMPRPNGVQKGEGLCRVCAGNDPATAEAAFRGRVAALGGAVIEPTWLGCDTPHRVRCIAGHDCAPRPNDMQKGRGLCRVCADNDPATAEAAFRDRVAALGGTVIEPTWLGVKTPHRVRCIAGHDCAPRPNGVQKGEGLCRVCAGNDPATAEAAFRGRVAALGGAVIEPTWLGVKTPHRVRCIAGHDCAPRPNDIQQGKGLCRACAGKDSATAETAFRDRVVALGGVVIEPTWLGNRIPHRVRCIAGHTCMPRPASVQQGQGLCRVCAGSTWNVFYVVEDVRAGRVKFGITSGDPSPRLADHRTAGYRSVIRVLTGLPGDTARAIERRVLSTLKLAGEQPIHGREYFGAHVLTTVLDIVDHYPIINRKDQVSC